MSTPNDTTQNEVWKDIPGYEGLYQASNLGRIMRLDRFGDYVMKHRLIDGYPAIDLTKDKKRKHYQVHRLIALTFIGTCPLGHEINHIDRNRGNASLSNLEYVTHIENVCHSKPFRKPFRKRFTSDELKRIEDMFVAGIPRRFIAKEMHTDEAYLTKLKQKHFPHLIRKRKSVSTL